MESFTTLPRAGLESLFAKVDFKQESAQVLTERMHQGVCRMVWARGTGQDLHWPGYPLVIGTAFAVINGRGAATIWNVCVDPAWQHRGLGMALVRRLVHILQVEEGVHQVALCSGPETVPFYSKLGFLPNPDVEVFI